MLRRILRSISIVGLLAIGAGFALGVWFPSNLSLGRLAILTSSGGILLRWRPEFHWGLHFLFHENPFFYGARYYSVPFAADFGTLGDMWFSWSFLLLVWGIFTILVWVLTHWRKAVLTVFPGTPGAKPK